VTVYPIVNAQIFNEDNHKNTLFGGAYDVWVDDDYSPGGYNDGHIWGYDAFDKIQDGIDNVTDSGNVFVNNGTYEELVLIDLRNSLNILGENRNDTIIDGNFEGDIMMIWRSNYIFLFNFTLTNSGPSGYDLPLDIWASENITISNCTLNNSKSYSIATSFTNNNVIKNCLINNSDIGGIMLQDHVFHNIITNCTITSGGYGLYILTNTSNNIIINNNISHNTYSGIWINRKNNTNNKIYNNNIIKNGPIPRITNALDFSRNTQWYYNGQGNYWSSMSLKYDSDKDGIIDFPYYFIINKDPYPSIKPYNI
jgi:parallel beta-helix repeat protein